MVSGDRITQFLKTDEIKEIKQLAESNLLNGELSPGELVITNGNFTWNQKFIDEANKASDQVGNFGSFASDMDSHMLLQDTINMSQSDN
jgi:hypothetical protein